MRKFSRKSLYWGRKTDGPKGGGTSLPLWNLKKHLGDFVGFVVVGLFVVELGVAMTAVVEISMTTTTNQIIVVVVDLSSWKKRNILVVVDVEEKD